MIFLGREPQCPAFPLLILFLVRRCRLTLLCSKHGERWKLARRCQPIFAAPANKRRALAGVLYVAGDTKIEDFALIIECAIIMPAYVSVPIKSVADHGADKIRIAIQNNISAWRVECHCKSTWSS